MRSLFAKYRVTSPDGTIRLAFAVDSAGRMTYSVTDGGVRLFEPSRLGFEAAEADLGGGFAVENVSRTSVDETWTQPWGENKENRSRYNEMAVRLRNGGGVRLTLASGYSMTGWDSATNTKRAGRIRSA